MVENIFLKSTLSTRTITALNPRTKTFDCSSSLTNICNKHCVYKLSSPVSQKSKLKHVIWIKHLPFHIHQTWPASGSSVEATKWPGTAIRLFLSSFHPLGTTFLRQTLNAPKYKYLSYSKMERDTANPNVFLITLYIRGVPVFFSQAWYNFSASDLNPIWKLTDCICVH